MPSHVDLSQRNVSIVEGVGVQKDTPQDVTQWYVDYFELKATQTLWAQEKLLFPSPSLQSGRI